METGHVTIGETPGTPKRERGDIYLSRSRQGEGNILPVIYSISTGAHDVHQRVIARSEAQA